jgi:hypothetical protein
LLLEVVVEVELLAMDVAGVAVRVACLLVMLALRLVLRTLLLLVLAELVQLLMALMVETQFLIQLLRPHLLDVLVLWVVVVLEGMVEVWEFKV